MHDDKWIAHWTALRDQILILDRETFDQRSSPTESHLNRLEVQLGVVLPASYRGFIRVFGPGDLATYVTVLSPGYRGSHRVDFLGQNQDWLTTRKKGPPPDFEGLIWFAYFSYGPMCGWDTSAMTNTVDSEYQILCRRGPQDIVPVAHTFHEFVDAVLSGGMASTLGLEHQTEWFDEETDETYSTRCFDPIVGSPPSPV
jgi:hypothetical protein